MAEEDKTKATVDAILALLDKSDPMEATAALWQAINIANASLVSTGHVSQKAATQSYLIAQKLFKSKISGFLKAIKDRNDFKQPPQGSTQ